MSCVPDVMRAGAERAMQSRGLLSSLSLDEYTLARYTASEVGNGTPEEKVAVAELARNRAALEGSSVSKLLLYRPGAGAGAYGPIHDSSMGAPFGRWASTSQDPTVADLLVANYALTGRTGDFARGGDDQVGPEVEGDTYHPENWALSAVAKWGAQGNYWVGQLPGVDHWRTFVTRYQPEVDPDSRQGRALIARGQAALSDRQRPQTSGLPVCPRGGGIAVAAGAGILAAGLGLGLVYRHG